MQVKILDNFTSTYVNATVSYVGILPLHMIYKLFKYSVLMQCTRMWNDIEGLNLILNASVLHFKKE